jgi:hypothetical protein
MKIKVERVDRLGQLRHSERRVELHLRGHDDLVGAQVLGAEMDAALH